LQFLKPKLFQKKTAAMSSSPQQEDTKPQQQHQQQQHHSIAKPEQIDGFKRFFKFGVIDNSLLLLSIIGGFSIDNFIARRVGYVHYVFLLKVCNYCALTASKPIAFCLVLGNYVFC